MTNSSNKQGKKKMTLEKSEKLALEIEGHYAKEIENPVIADMFVVNYLRNEYGLDDEDVLNSGEVQEVCIGVLNRFISHLKQSSGTI